MCRSSLVLILLSGLVALVPFADANPPDSIWTGGVHDGDDYDDVALCDSIMNEQGVPNYDRFLGLSSRDYNGLAGNIAGAAAAATRSFGGNKSNTAFERSFVGMVAGFARR